MPRAPVDAQQYWQDRPEQKLYVAFCLLMSSIQDSLIGLREAEQNNHNWSATCSYYSIVHAGRLLAFSAVCDFPKSHGELRTLFGRVIKELAAGQLSAPDSEARVVSSFDWLRHFTKGDDSPPLAEATNPGVVATFIPWYLQSELRIADATTRVIRFGNLLRQAADLRNDSNYEALLIANEHFHSTMGPAFARLSSVLNDVCHQFVLPLALQCFEGMVLRDSAFKAERPAFEAFAFYYLRQRLRERMMLKVSASSKAVQELDALLAHSVLRDTGADYKHLNEAVSYRLFGPKRQLMVSFNGKVQSLESWASEHDNGLSA